MAHLARMRSTTTAFNIRALTRHLHAVSAQEEFSAVVADVRTLTGKQKVPSESSAHES